MMKVKAEEVFKAIADAGWGVMSSGNLESPVGYFTVVEIPDHAGEREAMKAAVFSEESSGEAFDRLESGWFFLVQHADGSVQYGKCKNKDYALARYSLSRAAYEDWADHI